MKHQVWDDQSDDEEFSREIDAIDPEHAATEFADQDCDGQADGMYFDGQADGSTSTGHRRLTFGTRAQTNSISSR